MTLIGNATNEAIVAQRILTEDEARRRPEMKEDISGLVSELDVSTGRPLRGVAGATRKSCAWELLRTLSFFLKDTPSTDMLVPPHDADSESA